MSEYLHEIHITVASADRESFQKACQEIGVKPVVLDLQSRTNGVLSDAMTSSTIHGSRNDVDQEVARIIQDLQQRQLHPTRCKVETVAWHPSAADPSARRQDQYFECHIALELPVAMSPKQRLTMAHICYANNLHLSRNVFKRSGDVEIQMTTLRDYTASPQQMERSVAIAVSAFMRAEIKVKNHNIEFVLSDTTPSHDQPWMV